MDNKKVLVIGSLNMDMTVKVDKLPKKGKQSSDMSIMKAVEVKGESGGSHIKDGSLYGNAWNDRK